MLFDIGFILLAVLSPLYVLLAYRQGVKDRQKIEANEPIDPPRAVKVGNVSKRTADILDNLEVYDGTAKGQKEVSR